MERKYTAVFAYLAINLLLTACVLTNLYRPAPSQPDEKDRVNTAAAQTLAVLGTQVASGRSPELPGPPTKTPTATATVTKTPGPAPSKTPTATRGPDCNRAGFVRDVTIPDDSQILPNTVFVKTWELRNTGTCTWTANYEVVFAGRGNAMMGPAANQLTKGEVKPGETVQVSVSMRSPGDVGAYEGYWMLRSGDGQMFGLGDSGASPFFVKIRVENNDYSFADHMCSAEWSSGAGVLPCPGKDGDSQGYVLALKDPQMEDNQQRTGSGFLTMPEPKPGGYIVGKFPAVIVPAETDFRAVLSCHPTASGCYVRFKVTYRVDNGEEQLLGEWNEGYEGGVTKAVKDLDMVAGRSTAFYFYVYVAGTHEQSRAMWFDPRITK